jgi:hypothetical protein
MFLETDGASNVLKLEEVHIVGCKADVLVGTSTGCVETKLLYSYQTKLVPEEKPCYGTIVPQGL